MIKHKILPEWSLLLQNQSDRDANIIIIAILRDKLKFYSRIQNQSSSYNLILFDVAIDFSNENAAVRQ